MTPREKMIATTILMFQRDGYQATSWRKLIEASGTPWGSAHHYFPGGKEQLGVAAVELAAQQGASNIDRCFAENAKAADGVRQLLETTADGMARTGFRYGCAIATVALEMTPNSAVITAACESAFKLWRAALERGLVAGGVLRARAPEVATAVLATFEGCMLLARTTQSAECFRVGVSTLQLLIAANSADAQTHKEGTT